MTNGTIPGKIRYVNSCNKYDNKMKSVGIWERGDDGCGGEWSLIIDAGDLWICQQLSRVMSGAPGDRLGFIN